MMRTPPLPPQWLAGASVPSAAAGKGAAPGPGVTRVTPQSPPVPPLWAAPGDTPGPGRWRRRGVRRAPFLAAPPAPRLRRNTAQASRRAPPPAAGSPTLGSSRRAWGGGTGRRHQRGTSSGNRSPHCCLPPAAAAAAVQSAPRNQHEMPGMCCLVCCSVVAQHSPCSSSSGPWCAGQGPGASRRPGACCNRLLARLNRLGPGACVKVFKGSRAKHFEPCRRAVGVVSCGRGERGGGAGQGGWWCLQVTARGAPPLAGLTRRLASPMGHHISDGDCDFSQSVGSSSSSSRWTRV